ncbi:MAG: pitrilysin family protein [Planctomycetota bacterium]
MPRTRIFEARELATGVTLLHHRASKWKTETVRFVFVDRPDHRVAARAVGAHLLRHGHRRCRGLESVSRFFRQQYGGGVDSHVAIGSTRHLLTVRTNVVGGRHLPGRPDTLGRAMGFVAKVLREPWFAAPSFDVSIFERERANLLRAIDAVREDKSRWADQRLREEMFAGTPLAIPAHGRREDVEAVTLDEVRAALEATVSEAPILIYSVGERDIDSVAEAVMPALGEVERPALRVKKPAVPPLRTRPRVVSEVEDIAQARLAMGFRVRDWDPKTDVHAALFGDILLGGGSTSKLFKEIREKRSLAYSIWSSLDGAPGALVVSAGVDPAHLGRVQSLVRRQIAAVAEGRISAEELESARAGIAKSLAGTWDSPEAMVQFDLAARLGRRRERSPEALLARYEKVGVDDAAAIFRRLELDTVYRLGPEKRS